MKGVDTLSKYYSIHEVSKIIGISAQTLRNWDANGKLHPHHTTVSGYRYYSDEQLNQVINVKPKNRITTGYCRVSSHKQKDDLERQIDNVKTYLLAKGQPFEIMICPLSSRQVKYLKVSDKNTYISFWSVGIFMHTISLYIF